MNNEQLMRAAEAATALLLRAERDQHEGAQIDALTILNALNVNVERFEEGYKFTVVGNRR